MNDLLLTLIASLQAVVVLLSAQVAALPTAPQHANALVHSPVATQQTATSTAPLSFTAINNLYKDAVVNILCRGSAPFSGSTATGTIISPTGLILVNAHIAQYLLLEQATNAPIQCSIRIGSPAKESYKARVVYIPPAWVAKHAHQITSAEQRGTGEDDYALLQITGTVHGTATTTDALPFMQLDAKMLPANTTQDVLVRAYPAEFLGSNITVRALHAVATITHIGGLATFTERTSSSTLPSVDLISLGGTIVAQGGSSGGAVVNSAAKLIGIVVTSTRKAHTEDRDLKAITLSHINESFRKHTGKSLDEVLATPADALAALFKDELLQSAQVFSDVYNH